MKTIWHWETISFFIGGMVLTAGGWGFLVNLNNIPEIIGFFGGMVIGVTYTMSFLSKWKCWHFE